MPYLLKAGPHVGAKHLLHCVACATAKRARAAKGVAPEIGLRLGVLLVLLDLLQALLDACGAGVELQGFVVGSLGFGEPAKTVKGSTFARVA